MAQETIEVNASGCLLTRSDGSQNLLLHHELQRVEMFNEDEVYFLLIGPNASVVVSQRAQGADLLLRHLQKLPGFDNDAVVTAMAVTGKQLCWQRPDEPTPAPPI
jgi:hypothetical protein